jgi:Cu-Zn family superoxide dismutase
MKTLILASILLAGFAAMAQAASVTVQVNAISASGNGASAGKVTLTDTKKGLLVVPELSGLTPGLHGFHIHEKGDCGAGTANGAPAAGLAAGGHFDSGKTGKHEGPHGHGHAGDLPLLVVGDDGKATLPVLAPRLKVAQVKGRALMLHAGGDNYSDQPAALGGGGARVACGVIR